MPDRPMTTSRRAFAKTLAAAAAAPALLPAAVLGQTPTPTATPSPSPTGPTPTPTPAPPSSAAEALTEVVRVRWGKNLTGEQLDSIAKAIDGRLRGADAMKKVALANADEPDVVYFASAEGGS